MSNSVIGMYGNCDKEPPLDSLIASALIFPRSFVSVSARISYFISSGFCRCFLVLGLCPKILQGRS